MAVFELYSSPLQSRYKASICTKATFFAIAAFLFTVIPPLLLAYRSEGFWIKQAFYREQPDVKFKHQILLVVHTGSVKNYVTWSTYKNFNLLEQANLRIPLIKSREEDTNRDGKNDNFQFSIEMPILGSEDVHGVQVIFIFDYRLYRFSELRMEAMAYISHSSAMSGAQLNADGDLKLRLRQPLAHKGLDTRYDVPIINSDSVFAEDYSFSHIFSSYQERNVTTRFESDYPVWITGRGSEQPFVISGRITYPEETIVYIPGFWQVIKFGWIQYLSVLLLFIFLMERVKSFVFENQIVSTVVNKPLLETYKNHFN
ncbi:transmembrane protein 231-like [Diadema setosum]|uniref:transmembrane protein 231-like n=1 Tax=Diadema setosum TaxID=31175 RepID=UPI003B3B7187